MNKTQNLLFFIVIVSAIVSSYLFLRKRGKQEIAPAPEVKTIIIGTNAEYPPFSFIKDGTIVGLDIDVTQEACKRAEKQCVLQDKPFDALIPEIQLGTIHMIASGMTPTPERAKQVYFTTPHHEGDPLLIIAPKAKPIASAADLKGKTVIVNEGFTSDSYASSRDDIRVERFPSVSEGFLALKGNRGDAFISAQSAVQDYFNVYGKDNFSIVPIDNQIETYALVVSKKQPKLFQTINNVIESMIADGTMKQLKKKWDIQ